MSKVNWRDVIGTVAPALATALGGPLAGIAVKTIGDKLLGKPNATEADVEAAMLSADPGTLLKLRQIDAEFKTAMTQAGVKLEEVAAADRNSARQREITLRDSWTPRVIAVIVIGGFLYCVYAVLGGQITNLRDPLAIGLIGTMIGYISAKADTVTNYYFGSSSSSRAKDDTIATLSKTE